MNINELLEIAIKTNASDLHLKVGIPPLLRVYGDLVAMESLPPLTAADTKNLAYNMLSQDQQRKFEQEFGIDISYEIPDLARFRTHIFQQREMVGIVCRVIPLKVPTIEELGLPEICKEFCKRPRGLILITGSAGAGKTTTQSAIINHINENFPIHVMTIEDPIEFTHECKKALVNQRQLERDTLSFSEALKHVFREDPDVILIGEMRDLETIQLAVTAAETGHLVLGTLHTTDTVSTIDRIVDVFPPHQQPQVRSQLTVNLIGVISQLLIKKFDGTGRIAAFEILVAVPAVRALIRESKTYQIPSVLQTGRKQGMISMDQSLVELVAKKIVSYDEALSKAINPREFRDLVGKQG
ncbi:MAG: type IV pilus twitching motility protein PilT [Nitrospirota bacterium]